MRIIPKKIKVKNTVWKCYSMADVIVALIVFAIIFIAITAGQWAIAVILGLAAVGMFIPTSDGIFYTCIFDNIKFLFAKKKYTADSKNAKENIDALIDLKEIKDSGLIAYKGGMYGRVIKVGQKNFGIEDVVQQNVDINYFANALKQLDGTQCADVEKNVSGQMTVAKELDADFYFFQEVDVKADRSYGIDMYARAKRELDGYSFVYAENFRTAKLLYPFNDPIGKTKAGIVTLSKYRIESAVRRSFPITESFIDKLFDLDRCFSVQYLPIAGSDKKLVMINLHMSAYDEGGTVRARQLEMLNSVLSLEYEAGNYVIAGGDFNHCLIADKFDSDEQALSYFPSERKVPEWVKNSVLHASELPDGFEIVADIGTSTCRGADMPYTPGVNYTTVIDGFIVSKNITVEYEHTVDTQYAYSNHNPVEMSFSLDM